MSRLNPNSIIRGLRVKKAKLRRGNDFFNFCYKITDPPCWIIITIKFYFCSHYNIKKTSRCNRDKSAPGICLTITCLLFLPQCFYQE